MTRGALSPIGLIPVFSLHNQRYNSFEIEGLIVKVQWFNIFVIIRDGPRGTKARWVIPRFFFVTQLWLQLQNNILIYRQYHQKLMCIVIKVYLTGIGVESK